MMNLVKPFLVVLLIAAMSSSCSPLRGRKALVVDDDGRSMRFDNGRAESRNKRWNGSKSMEKQRKKRDKAFRNRRRN